MKMFKRESVMSVLGFCVAACIGCDTPEGGVFDDAALEAEFVFESHDVEAKGVPEVRRIAGDHLEDEMEAHSLEADDRHPDESDVDDHGMPLSTEELSDEPPSAEGPGGQCCFVHCGGTGVYQNLWWVQHNCNGVGWDWCAGYYGTSLINAEWWPC